MNLQNLTTSGWVLFCLCLCSWLGLLTGYVRVLRGQDVALHNNVLTVGVLTAWLLWLVTP